MVKWLYKHESLLSEVGMKEHFQLILLIVDSLLPERK
jgi:hypothetical protein